MLCYVMLCYVMLCYVMLCYVMYVMLCHVMLRITFCYLTIFLICDIIYCSGLITCKDLRSAARSLEGASDLSTLSWELLQVPLSYGTIVTV
jgi:hypothetical protein